MNKLGNRKMALNFSPFFLLLVSTTVSAEENRRMQIAEDAAIGTVVGRIMNNLTSSIDGGPAFILIYPPESQVEQTFLINDRNGEIKTRIGLDYEIKSTYVFLAIPHGEKTSISGDGIRVIIDVLDVNDFRPQFPQKRVELQISEYAKIGTETPLPAAIDRDGSEQYGVQKYELVSGNVNNAFRLGVRRLNRLLYADLVVNSELDRTLLDHYNLEIRASDGGELMDTLYVNITILDANDMNRETTTAFITANVVDLEEHKPEIKIIYLSEDGRAVISEAAEVGSLIARVSVSDPDTNGVFVNRTGLSIQGDDETFGVNESSGAVYVFLKKRLDREVRTNYSLTVLGKVGETAYQRTMVFKVLDINDNQPVLKRPYYETEIREKSNPGTSVLRVEAVDADEGENAAITYSFAPSSAKYSTWLDIDPETGLITTADTIDCEISSRPEYTIVATDHGKPSLSSTAKLTVTVLDINNSPPVFLQSLYNASVREDADIGYCFLKVQAIDPDCGVNAQIQYKLSPDTPGVSYPFEVDKNTGNVCLLSKLDYERKRNYQFPVLAYDGGGLSGSTVLILTVDNENDNTIIYYPEAYNATVRLHTPPGTAITTVYAKDADDGEFGTVNYGILSGNDDGAFRIDRTSGVLYVDRPLSLATYQLVVQATDGAGLTSAHPATVTVTVLADDSPSPQFDHRLYRFTVREDTLPGISIGTVRAHSVNGAAITYAIYSGDPMGNFTIDHQTGSISIARYLDHEVEQKILLNIRASTDHPLGSNHSQVEVIIEDLNDEKVLFERKFLRMTIPEDHPLQKPVFVCYADDRDSGKNGDVRYRLLSNPGNFMIHPVSGEIRLTQSLDFEIQTNYTLTVLAQDAGVPPLSDNMILEILVLDTNTHDPKFNISQYRAVVTEGAIPMTPVIQVQASDRDSGINGQITYRLDAFGSGFFPFRIFADSGWIYVRHALDRETKREYSFTAIASDQGQPRRSASVPVIITISDINDHAPSISERNLTILENRPPGSLVGRISAEDPDEGENGTVTYSLSLPQLSTHFRLTPNGELYTESALDREFQAAYDLTILASDAGRPPLSSLCTIRVTILDENDHDPHFVLPLGDRLYFREEQPKGSEVAQIRATDPDNGENGTVTYRLESPEAQAPFALDPETGVLSSMQVFDYETGSKIYEIAVIAEDRGRPPRSSRKIMVIEIVDIDDGGGVSNDTVIFEVSELAPIGYRIGPVDQLRQFTDLDVISLTDAERVTDSYEIVSGNGHGIFDIDRLTSTLYLIGRLDYETSSAHFLIINKVAQSKYARTQARVETRVKIIVINENDAVPAFNEDPVVFSVPENKAGFVVWQYNATDGDIGSNGRVEYKILGQYPGELDAFELNSVSGELTLKRELDYEKANEYLLLIEASDQSPNATQRKSGRVTTRVYVTDINDASPVIISRDHQYVSIDTPVGYPLMYVAAVDADWLENGRVTYRITAGNEEEQFHLNESSGSLSLLKPLKRESISQEYRLTVVAEDHGVPQRTASQVLTLRVQDVDDSLRFEQSVYRVNVTENGPSGVVAAQLRAHSPDGGDTKELLYVLLNGTYSNKFRMNEKTGTLTTAGPLDREEIDEYLLTVYVRDSPSAPRYDVATVVVKVEDVNDFNPEVSAATCLEQPVPENQPFDVFHTIIASDRDSGENGHLNFAIVGGNVDGKFRINSSTGEIGCEALDRETTASYNLTIQVRDNGSPSLTAQCSLPIYVLDENDCIPRFEQSSYSAQVQENTPPGTTVLKIKAVDLDDGLNGQVMYTIANETAGLFDIGANSGEIVVLGKLDYEQGNAYSFMVKAYDQGPSESRWDLVRITIQILDANDNSVIFANVPFIANVSADIAAGQRIVKVAASDADGPGPNSEISYSLVNSEDTRFVINPTTGVISAKQNLRLSPSTIEYLTVVATDHGDQPRSTTSVVEIVVASSGDSSHPGLRFSQPAYQAQIAEDAVAGAKVIDLLAASPTTLSPVEYKIISGNDMDAFTLDPNKGSLLIADSSHTDFETNRMYQLIVEAKVKIKDPDVFERAYVPIRIDISDSNDHTPQFLQQRYSANVLEGKPRGAFVIQVSATDGDIAENAALTYSIVSGNVDSAFVVDNGGIVKTNAELDREIHDRYTLTVMAVDSGSPPKSGTATVDVLVIDKIDNSPIIPAIRPLKISESAAVGSLLTIVTANDVDTFPPLVYSLGQSSKNQSGYFNLDRFTGRLVLARELDYEKDREFDLEIQVSDGVYVTSARQKIMVLDENDDTPIFAKPYYQAVLPLGALPGVSIARVSAIDRDSGANGQVHYAFVGSTAENMGFWIDANNGEIFLNRTVNDRSQLPPILQFSVAAIDSGRPAKSAVTTVIIQVGYDTEKRVDFASKLYSFTVNEDAAIHSVIGRIATTAVNDTAKRLRFVTKSGDPNNTFNIDSDGNVVIMKRLDREAIDSYTMDLALHTRANALSNSSARLSIVVLDTNDNSPSIDEREYQVTVQDSLAPGAVITKINAIDPDSGENGTVMYGLMSGDVENAFAVDPQTGALTLRRSIAGTTVKELRLFVRASDHGSPARNSLAIVNVRIRSEYSSPFFPLQRYIGWVTENAPVGTAVLKVKAAVRYAPESISDRFSINASNLTYSIMNGNDASAFRLDAVTGELRTSAILDYEESPVHRLSIIVSDASGHWTNASAHVLVRGVDEFAPVFTQSKFIFQASYDAQEGEAIGAIAAHDHDAGADGKVIYAITDQSAYFRIHPETGVLSVASPLTGLKDAHGSNIDNGRSDSTKEPRLVFLTVIAYSGPDAVSGKVNSTKVEIQISHLPKSASSKLGATSAIVSISVALIILLIFILALVAIKLRRRENKPSFIHEIKSRRSARTKKTRQFVKANDVIQPCPRAASRAAGFYGSAGSNGNSLRSEGGTMRVENIGNQPPASSAAGFKTRTDAAIRAQADDNGSITSELPSTREYLTSLGVEAVSSNNHDYRGPSIGDHQMDRHFPGSPSDNRRIGHGDARDAQREEDAVDVQDLIYSKVNEVLASENESIGDKRRTTDRSQINDSLDFDTGIGLLNPRTSWPNPLPQSGPSYQPLTQVFSEIAKIKSDTLRRRREEQSMEGAQSPRTLGSFHGAPRQNGLMDRSPGAWAPTDFASPDEPNSGNAYAISDDLHSSMNGPRVDSRPLERRSVAELEIKI